MLVIFPMKLLLQYYYFEGGAYLLSTFIIILSAWYGGIGPGIFATIIAGILVNLLLLEPKFIINEESILTTFIFFIQGILISMISEAKRHADLQKDEFISFASHELKNPLSVIKGYLSLIQTGIADKKIKKRKIARYTETADAYVDKTTNLINELLDVTKIESSKLTLRKEKFPIHDLVKSIITDQRMLTDTHKIQFISKTTKKVYADKTRLNQVITNMVTNAIKYSAGKKKIIVTVSSAKNVVKISVQDFGIGLSDDAQKKVFERFYRAPDSQTEGLGLGLFIAQQIAVLHKGRIYLQSELGKGTTFYLELPAV